MACERKSKRREPFDCPVDLISDLPATAINVILDNLSLRDAARLSVLSRKWRDSWTSTPSLDFNADFFISVLGDRRFVTHEFSGIVSKILFNHSGPIIKFSLYIPRLQLQPDVNQWISFLSTSNIRYFTIQNQSGMPLILTSRLFSMARLENLELHYCEFSFLPSCGDFKKLVRLDLRNVIFREGTFEDLITKCPLLKNLILADCSGIEHVNVDTPGITTLNFVGTFKSLRVRNAKNLVFVVIVLVEMREICPKESLRDLFESLGSSSVLKTLGLGGYLCKVLFSKCLISTTFDTLRRLRLDSVRLDDLECFSSAVRAIQRCPNVQSLKISVISSNRHPQILVYDRDITLNHLRHAQVEISGASSTELRLIEFVLACSPVLKILRLSYLREIDCSYHLRLLKKLMKFRTASPTVKIIFPSSMIT